MNDQFHGNSRGPQHRGSHDAPFVMTPNWLVDLICERVPVGKERSGKLRYLSGDHIAVQVALQRHWNPDRPVVFPSVERLAMLTGYSVRTVQVLLRELEEVGAICALRRGARRGRVAAPQIATCWRVGRGRSRCSPTTPTWQQMPPRATPWTRLGALDALNSLG